MVAAAAAAGLVVWLLIVALVPPRTSPVVALAQLDALYQAVGERTLHPDVPAAPAGLVARLGGWAERFSARRGIRYGSLRADLAVSGRRLDETIGAKVLAGAGGFVATLLLLGVLAGAGLPVPPAVVVVVAAAAGVGLFFVPDAQIRSAAKAHREEFRHALSAYLDWVQLEMAGRAAPAEALPAAARVGAGWPFALIRDTLFRAARAGTDQWTALAELGSRLGVVELRDLGQLIHLVAADGAQVRSTLTARAAAMRRTALAEATGEAGRKDQSLQMAQILLGLGLLVFIGYPAMVNILSF